MTAVAGRPVLADLLEVTVPAGGRVLVVSDTHLTGRPTAAETLVSEELARAVERLTGPGVIVLGGDILELLAGPSPQPGQILAAHDRLAEALRSYASTADHRVVYTIGNHDWKLAWDGPAAKTVCERLGAELAMAVDLVVQTGAGIRRVRVEHGNRLDPVNSFTDPRNPLDAPLGHHVVRELMPALEVARRPWLEGLEWLSDPVAFPSFVASRLAYRRLARHLTWLLLPVLLAVLLKVPLAVDVLSRARLSAWPHRLALLGFAVLADVLLVATAVVAAARQAWEAVSATNVHRRGRAQNDAARAEAQSLAGSGWAGLITGHTHQPELVSVGGGGFYANSGCCTTVVDECPARAGLPPVFIPFRKMSWIELEAAGDLRIRLFHAAADLPGASTVERLAARRPPNWRGGPKVVAALPSGPTWPAAEDEAARVRRTRLASAFAIGVIGVVDILSALTPPLAARLRVLRTHLPLAVPEAAAALAAAAGVGLLLVARGVAHGGRRAWRVGIALLLGSFTVHLLKGGDLEEATLALVALLFLLSHRRAFRESGAPQAFWTSVRILVASVALATAVGTAAIELATRSRDRLPFGRALVAAAERLIGLTGVRLPDRLNDFLTPALATVGLGALMVAGWLFFSPAVPRHEPKDPDEVDEPEGEPSRSGPPRR